MDLDALRVALDRMPWEVDGEHRLRRVQLGLARELYPSGLKHEECPRCQGEGWFDDEQGAARECEDCEGCGSPDALADERWFEATDEKLMAIDCSLEIGEGDKETTLYALEVQVTGPNGEDLT